MPDTTATQASENTSVLVAKQRHSILIVDDEMSLRELLSEILTSDGYDVVTASDGKEAVNLIAKRDFDLVITDIMMPEVNGIQVLQQALKKDPDYLVIMITGFPSIDTAVKLVNLGAMDYIVKPFDIDLIKLTVAKILALGERAKNGAPAASTAPMRESGDWDSADIKRLLDCEVARSEFRDHKLSVMLLEIDSLNMYAGENGAVTADELIEKFTKTLAAVLRPGDISGQTSEGEWTVILPETNREQAQELAEKINADAVMYCSISGGYSCFPWDAPSGGELIEKARVSKLLAKRKGGGQILSKS